MRIRTRTVFIGIVLVFAVAITGALWHVRPAEPPAETAFKVGFLLRAQDASPNVNERQNAADGGSTLEHVIHTAGGELVIEYADFSPLGILHAVTKLIEAECDGLLLMPTEEYILPQIAMLCDEAEVYWAISFRPIHDPQIKEIVQASPYYAGSVNELDESVGYDLTRILAQNGKKEIALISTPVSDPVGVARERGIYRAAEEFDLNIAAEVRNADTDEEVYTAVSDMIVAKPEIDAIFRVGSLSPYSDAIIRAIEDSGRAGDIQYVSIDWENIGEDAWESGIVLAAAGGHKDLDISISAAILINAIMGCPIDGDCWVEYTIPYVIVDSYRDLQAYYARFYAGDDILFSEDEVREYLLKSHNPTLEHGDYLRLIQSYTTDYE